MAYDAHANFASSLVVAPPVPPASGTTLTVTSGQGALFPAVPFNAIVLPAGTIPTPSNAEIVRVTNIAGDVLTITRAQEGTAARTILIGDFISNAITAKDITDIEAQALGGTVTAVSVANANGFAGSSSGGAIPALTLSTSITGVLKGGGTAISAATAGSDYANPAQALKYASFRG